MIIDTKHTHIQELRICLSSSVQRDNKQVHQPIQPVIFQCLKVGGRRTVRESGPLWLSVCALSIILGLSVEHPVLIPGRHFRFLGRTFDSFLESRAAGPNGLESLLQGVQHAVNSAHADSMAGLLISGHGVWVLPVGGLLAFKVSFSTGIHGMGLVGLTIEDLPVRAWML